MNKLFKASDFTSTLEFDTAEDKAKFANQFVEFVRSGYDWKAFPKWFYTRLSNTFGHIAHYNQQGFYSVFFIDKDGRELFIRETLAYGCWGQPEFTYCDVEKALQKWLKAELF